MGEKFGILLVGSFLSHLGGFRCFGEDLAAQLSAAGWPTTLVSQKTGRLSRPLDMLYTAWRLRQSYTAAYVEVYSGLAFCWAELVCWLLRRLNKPYVLTLHGGNLPIFARRWPNRVRRLLGSARQVTAPSSYLYEQMKPYRANMSLLPSAFNLSAYPYHERKQPQPQLVWLRAFHKIYNPALGPQVLQRLAEEFPAIHLTMTGPDKGDSSAQETVKIAEELQVLNRLRQTGGIAKAEVPARLNEGDIFLNTTNIDNTPMSVIEAMACGLCVISTNVGGLPYLLKHEQDALLVPPNDAAAMAAAVRRILTEPELGAKLSRNARQKVESLDWGEIVPVWERLFASIVKLEETAPPQ